MTHSCVCPNYRFESVSIFPTPVKRENGKIDWTANKYQISIGFLRLNHERYFREAVISCKKGVLTN